MRQVSGFSDLSQARVMFFDGKEPVHGPALTFQPADATLTALAALNSTAGMLAQTGADTFTKRTLTGTANQITVTDGDGVSGNPTLSLAVGALLVNTWTPTLTAVSNIAATTANAGYYIRLGSLVLGAVTVAIDPTAASATSSEFNFSLPVASDFSAATQLTGVANSRFNGPGNLFANTTDNRGQVNFLANNAGNTEWNIVFLYEII